MRTPLVFWNLWHQKWRTAMAIAGVAFAILLVFMQLGFYGSAEISATSIYDALDFDLLIRSREYLCLTSARSFPRYRLQQALGHADVERVAPVYIEWQLWRNKDKLAYYGDKKQHAYRRALLAVALNLSDPIFNPSPPSESKPPTRASLQELSEPNTVLVDTYTRKYFGEHGTGARTELNGKAIHVVGEFTIGPGLGADGLVVMSDRTLARLTGASTLEWPTLGLIKLKRDARDRITAIKEELKQSLFPVSQDVEVLTHSEVGIEERDYWLRRTPVGVVFTMGVAVAFLVGLFYVYQVIATDIADRSSEYATLKAMGYGPWYLSGVVLQQATAYAVFGYILGLPVALLLYWLGRYYEKILLFSTWERIVGVLLMSIVMCSLSGLLAIHKVNAADPADLF